MNRNYIVLILCIWTGQWAAIAQTINGIITDANTGKPVYANLRFEPFMQPDSVRIISNDVRTGQFSYTLLPQTSYTLEVFATGYLPIIHSIPTEADRLDPMVFRLSPLLQNDYFQVSSLTFEQNKATITGGFESLNAVANYLVQNQQFKLRLEGHTEIGGAAKAQFKLSKERLEAVKSYLVSRGVKANKMQLKALGGRKPLTTDTHADAQAQNRRVEFRLIR